MVTAAVVAVIAAVKWWSDERYDAGWNAAVVEQDRLIREAQQAAVDKARQEWENLTSAAEAEIIVEEKIVERIRVVEKEIPTVVERIVEVTPECNDLGDDFAGLLNAQISAGGNREVSNPAVASDTDP